MTLLRQQRRERTGGDRHFQHGTYASLLARRELYRKPEWRVQGCRRKPANSYRAGREARKQALLATHAARSSWIFVCTASNLKMPVFIALQADYHLCVRLFRKNSCIADGLLIDAPSPIFLNKLANLKILHIMQANVCANVCFTARAEYMEFLASKPCLYRVT